MTASKYTVVIVAFLTLLSISPVAKACSCLKTALEEKYKSSDAIHKGILQSAKLVDSKYIEGTLKILLTLKGNDQQKLVTIKTPASGESCGIQMTIGQTLLVFINNGENWVTLCGGSGAINDAEYLKLLNMATSE